jgi:hypothetical protein
MYYEDTGRPKQVYHLWAEGRTGQANTAIEHQQGVSQDCEKDTPMCWLSAAEPKVEQN